ncbi:MAG: SMC family ATPase [Methanothrix sp.]|nr:MAG: SMC family ATPase [Methanothrix sp.]
MHLNRLVLRNFKKFKRADVAFQDGLTGIVGSNGAGKSTIVEAIAWALYGNRASSIKRDFLRNSRAGESDPVEVRLSMSLGKQEITIFRAMKGKTLMPEAFLLLDGQPIASGTKEVDTRLEEILKINYQDFMKTFYARQKDLDNLLKEGGMGKREYLLKLLGLDDIREAALETIKSDRSGLDEQKNRLAGALAEIGDVQAGMEAAAQLITKSEGELQEAERLQSVSFEARQKLTAELNSQSEKKHANDILDERRTRLAKQSKETVQAKNDAERRLAEIESSRKELASLEPQLERLKIVLQSLENLEPKRKEHEETSRLIAAAGASLEGVRRALAENDGRLAALRKDAASLDELKVKEQEHSEVQIQLGRLEGLRDQYADLQAQIKQETVRLSGTDENLAKTNAAIKELNQSKSRLEEIAPCREEAKRLDAERKRLELERERQKTLEGLTGQSQALESRRERLESEAAEVRGELFVLEKLEEQETALQAQDRELDRLGTDLNRILAELRGTVLVQEKARLDAQQSLKKVMALGAQGVCPTCERPLEGQRDQLLEKYKLAVSEAENEIAALGVKIKEQMARLEGAAGSRSRLRLAFDDLNAKKSRRSGLQAKLNSLLQQISECMSEQKEIKAKIEALGDVLFDAERLAGLEAAQRELAPLVEECAALPVRLQELPRREAEQTRLQEQRAALEALGRDLTAQIQALSYAESDYLDAKKRFAILKPLHDRFLSLQYRVQEIPVLEKKNSLQRQELETLIKTAHARQESLAAIGFDPVKYDELQKERKILVGVDERAQKIRLKLAALPEMQRRLAEAVAASDALQKDLAEAGKELAALAYNPKEHEATKLAKARAEVEHEAAQKTVSEKKVQLAVLKGGLERLKEAAQRKKEHERTLDQVGRRLEVVDTTRGLINGFMDQVLIRVKKDIAKTAGEILEEVSGKYSLLKIDDEFNILVEDGSDWYPISRYSGGEIDMIAVSVRVAISEYLMRFGPEGESYSFLIMDEVFGSQDLEHREKMIQMLRSLEERFPQIIAISHISDVQGQFDNTLQVVEDEMGNSRVEAF